MNQSTNPPAMDGFRPTSSHLEEASGPGEGKLYYRRWYYDYFITYLAFNDVTMFIRDVVTKQILLKIIIK